jgi:hypothetical protein
MRRPTLVALIVMQVGCGLTMTTGPDPARPREQRPACTESMSAPKRDGIGAVIGFVALIAGVAFLNTESANEDVATVLVVGGAVTMAASYASGGIGYYRVKRCRAAIAKFDAQTVQSVH